MYRFLFFIFMCIGCKHRVKLESIPSGATVYYNGKELGSTPLEKTFTWWPTKNLKLQAKLPNYLPMTIDVSETMGLYQPITDIIFFRHKRLWGVSPRSTHQYIMIRRHGPAGSWTAEDAKKMR